ncbi:MAG: sterol desaturase family protein [Erythrobacter sp.]|nr:sterol desaturase family protein [Erythrobacter sp.]
MDAFLELGRQIGTMFGRYFVLASILTFILLFFKYKSIRVRLLRSEGVQWQQIRRELWHSTIAIVIMVLTFVGILSIAVALGFERPRPSQVEMGLAGTLISYFLILIAHDAYFYWTHRAMHSRYLFRTFHAVHHRSIRPTAWTAYSFSMLETVVTAAFFPIYLLIVPVPLAAVVAFGLTQIIWNAASHSGVELSPKFLIVGRHPFNMTGAVHHDIHHRYGRYNFGLYFRFWDKVMGTEHPDFEKLFRYVTSSEYASDVYERDRSALAQ